MPKNPFYTEKIVLRSGVQDGGVFMSNGSEVVSKDGKYNPALLEEVTPSSFSNETLKVAEVTVSAATIIATGAGSFGHSAGVNVVANPGTGKYVELVGAVLFSTYGVAAYTAGGNITIDETDGSAITGLISAANSLGASASVVAHFAPLSVTARAITENKGINIVAATAFTNPGTATGTFKIKVYYRVHTL